MPLLKPGRWTVNPADIDPLYLDLWRGMALACLYWQGSGVPVFFLGSKASLISPSFEDAPVWGVSQRGPHLHFDGADDALRIDGGEIPSPSYPQTAFSLMLVFRTTDTDTNAVFLGMGKATATQELVIIQNTSPSGGDGIKLLIRDTNSASRAVGSSTTAHRDGKPHVVIVSHPGGNVDPRMWLDGVEQTATDVSGSMTTQGSVFNTRTVGALRRTSTALFADMDAILTVEWQGREFTPSEARLLTADPFGLIRPQLFIDAGLTVDLYATATGTITAVVDETDATSDIHLSVDDDPDSPNDADWMNSSVDTGQIFLGLTDMPAAFGNADTADIDVRYRGQVWQEGSLKLFVQLFQSNESTSLSNEVEIVTVSGDGSFANTNVTITGVDTGASKAVWDAAVVRFRWGVS